jgi:hypothetical protein
VKRSPHTTDLLAIGTSASSSLLHSPLRVDVGEKVRAQHACHPRLGKNQLVALELAPVPSRQTQRRSDGPAREARFRAGGLEGNTASEGGNFHHNCLSALFHTRPSQGIFPDCHGRGINESVIE